MQEHFSAPRSTLSVYSENHLGAWRERMTVAKVLVDWLCVLPVSGSRLLDLLAIRDFRGIPRIKPMQPPCTTWPVATEICLLRDK